MVSSSEGGGGCRPVGSGDGGGPPASPAGAVSSNSNLPEGQASTSARVPQELEPARRAGELPLRRQATACRHFPRWGKKPEPVRRAGELPLRRQATACRHFPRWGKKPEPQLMRRVPHVRFATEDFRGTISEAAVTRTVISLFTVLQICRVDAECIPT